MAPGIHFPDRIRGFPLVAALLIAVGWTGISGGAQAAQVLPEVQVVDIAPLPGMVVPLSQVPANVQSVTGEQLSRQPGSNLSELLNQNLGSVNVNDTQGNPFQRDVNFRGFSASPILGTPQGLSVFVDGVRVNEAFGDTVNWDLIPKSAIAGITVLPGSNPLFGLNTLGGAIAIATKNGFQNPGTGLRVSGGSFGRQSYEFESGGHGDHADYFMTASLFDDNGWGQHNPSRVNQWFAKTGFQNETTQLNASLTYADTKLSGNQTIPLSFFGDPTQAYTYPDVTANRLAFFNLNGSHAVSDRVQFSANGYYRTVNTNILNSNISDRFDPALPPGPGNQPALNAINVLGENRYGGSLQLSLRGNPAGRSNQLTVGLSYDHGDTDFSQYSQEAPIAPDRGTGSAASVVALTSLQATVKYQGWYFTDTYALSEKIHMTLAGRYNRATLDMQDRIGTALNGNHSFQRFNPALGFTYNPANTFTAFAAYNEGMRIPTPVELSCADRNAPCSLPNAFSADPPLNAVVSKTWETGVRGRWGPELAWSAALFRASLDNDIQFISSGGSATSTGFFQNVGTTRREGLELGLDDKVERFTLSARYSYISATFQTPLVLNSPNNSSAQPISCPTCTDIQVVPGNRMPGIPRHLLKLRVDYRHDDNLKAGMSVYAASGLFARGDENNLDVNGPVPGYAFVNLDARLRLARNLDLLGTVSNLFNRQYQTFGVLGQNVFTAPGNTFDNTGASFRAEQFRAASAPRAAWIGLAYRYSTK